MGPVFRPIPSLLPSTTRRSCWARMATSTGAGGAGSCLCSWARRVRVGHAWGGDVAGVNWAVEWAGCPRGARFSPFPRRVFSLAPPSPAPSAPSCQTSPGPSPSCPRGSGMRGTPTACSPGPRALRRRSASQVRPCQGTGVGGEGTLLCPGGWGQAGWDGGLGWSGVGAGWRGRTGRWGNRSPCWSQSKVEGCGGVVLAAAGQQPVCFRVGARTPFLGVSGQAGAHGRCLPQGLQGG